MEIATYVMRARERLMQAQEDVEQMLNQKADKQKRWFDQHVHEVELQPGNHVLLLLPHLEEKQEWKGPYNVIAKKGHVNYEIELPEQNCTK